MGDLVLFSVDGTYRVLELLERYMLKGAIIQYSYTGHFEEYLSTHLSSDPQRPNYEAKQGLI